MRTERFKSIPTSREDYEPIVELKKFDDIEDFTVRKEKVSLPRVGSSNKGYQIYFLNTSIEEISRILKNEHPMIVNHATSYRGYYYNHLLLRKAIITPRVKNPGKTIGELKMERLEDYGLIRSSYQNVITPKSDAVLVGKNFIYDLEPLVRLMKIQPKLKQIPLVERLRLFFMSVGKLYEKTTVMGYKKGPIYINLDEYDPKGTLQDFSFYELMMILLKKSDKVISRVMADVPEMEIMFYTEKGYILYIDEFMSCYRINANSSWTNRIQSSDEKTLNMS